MSLPLHKVILQGLFQLYDTFILLKLASESAHLHWKWVERGLHYSCSSIQSMCPIQRNCEQTLALGIRLGEFQGDLAQHPPFKEEKTELRSHGRVAERNPGS